MQHAQDPGHQATEGLEPTHPAAGPDRPARANRSLRVRMIGAVLVAGIATVAVGGFGINRMSALSEAADVVYAEGTSRSTRCARCRSTGGSCRPTSPAPTSRRCLRRAGRRPRRRAPWPRRP